MVVLLVMVALLGLGLTGLFLTTGSIQVSTNINLRNQALVVAEAGIERARSILNNPASVPPVPSFLAGSGNPADEIPNDVSQCQGQARGAVLMDLVQSSSPCTQTPCALRNIAYPSVSRTADLPSAAGTPASPTLGTYTVYIRQDLVDCRMANFICDQAVPSTGDAGVGGGSGQATCSPPPGSPDPNGTVVIRSEGVASDGRTRVVLEVTMTAALTSQRGFNTPVSALCASGASGCDDNASVQSGIVVNSNATQTPPSSGGVSDTGGTGGTGGVSGTGGTLTPPGTGGASGGSGGNGTGGSIGCGTSTCTSSQICCGGACCAGTCCNNTCCAGTCCNNTCCAGTCCNNACCTGTCTGGICCPTNSICNNIAVIGEYGIWQAHGRFNQWLATHSSTCNKVDTLTIESDPNSSNNWTAKLSNYGILIVLDVFHTAADIASFQSTRNYWTYGNFGSQRAFTDTEVNSASAWVRSGRGLMTVVGTAGVANEVVNPNKLLAKFNLGYGSDHAPEWFLRGISPASNCWIKNGNSKCPWEWMTTAPLSMANVPNLQVDSGFPLLALGSGPVALARPLLGSYFYSWGNVGMVVDSGLSSPSASGRVVAWTDEWLTYDNDWVATSECPAIADASTPYWQNNLNSCTQRFWNNIVTWLRANCSSP